MKKCGKKWLSLMLASMMVLAGCGAEDKKTDETKVISETNETNDDSSSVDQTEVESVEVISTEEGDTEEQEDFGNLDGAVIRIGGLKGPTSMGMAKMLWDATNETSLITYEYTLATAADELTPLLVQGKLDVAAVPSNLASILYANTDGAIEVLAINTLGVTYIVDTGDSVQSIEDLKGKTIYATGMGTVPEYTLRYVLEQNGIDPDQDVTLEFKSEPTEIVSLMASSSEEVVAMLPQPFVTVATTQVEDLRVALSVNDEWDALGTGNAMVTGVLVVRKEFVEENPDLMYPFLFEYANSVTFVNQNPKEAATMIEALDIVKAPIAEKAIPYCNMTTISGTPMKQMLSGFYEVLYEKNPKSVGGSLPDDDFYYILDENE